MRWDRLDRVRQFVPVRMVPALVRRRMDRIWADPAYRAQSQANMEFVLAHTERAGEAAELARGYAEYTVTRNYHRWHPRLIGSQEIRGIEWLTTERDRTRPLILNFFHHHQYYGMFASLERCGAPKIHLLILDDVLAPDVHESMRQHVRMLARGTELVPTGQGLAALAELLTPGMVLAIASDVPGRTEVEFLGRRVRGSSGAARLAVMTGTPVVVTTAHRDPSGSSYIQVHPPIEPDRFAGPDELLAELLRVHGEAVMAWPEALDTPLARWGALED